jgi:hypothetical protein
MNELPSQTNPPLTRKDASISYSAQTESVKVAGVYTPQAQQGSPVPSTKKKVMQTPPPNPAPINSP